MNIVFMGTPPFAAALLRRIYDWTTSTISASGADPVRISGVYCQPDRPAGRGHKLTPPAVKVLAQELGLPVFQPLHFKEEADRAALAALAPDVLVVAAYGLILPKSVLDIPRQGPWNVHASLLPRYRGAAPVERALMSGETHTGVTIMRMETGLDTGPMALQRALGIGIDETGADLLEQLEALGGDLMVEVLEQLRRGEAPTLIPQDPDKATYAAKLRREDGYVDWNAPVYAVHALVRGVTPRPGARTVLRGAGLEDTEILFSPGMPQRRAPGEPLLPPGTVLPLRRVKAGEDDCVVLPIVCADGEYLVRELRPANRKAMSAEAFVNGFMPALRLRKSAESSDAGEPGVRAVAPSLPQTLPQISEA